MDRQAKILDAKLETIKKAWRNVRLGNLRVTSESVILSERWRFVFLQLEALIKHPRHSNVVVGGEVIHGFFFFDYQVDWANSQIVDPGKLIILFPKIKNHVKIYWATEDYIRTAYEQGSKDRYAKSMIIATNS